MAASHYYTMAGLVFVLLSPGRIQTEQEIEAGGREAKAFFSSGDGQQNLFPGGLDPPISSRGENEL